MQNILKSASAFLLIYFAFAGCAHAQDVFAMDQAVEDVIALYDDVDIVALGEGHARKRQSDFRLSLISTPQFLDVVDVIVVEFANPLYQGVIDAYVLGADVPREEFVKIWRDTTQVGGVWDSPVYEAFFTTVRGVNVQLPTDRRLRVIAADPPVDWSVVREWKDFRPFTNRGRYPIGIIEREVYAKGLNALLIFGTTHTERWGIGFVETLEKNHPGSIHVIMPPPKGSAGKDILRSLARPEDAALLLRLKDTPLGAAKHKDIYWWSHAGGSLKLSHAGDSVLYLGHGEDETAFAPEDVLNDAAYQAERKRRLRVLAEDR